MSVGERVHVSNVLSETRGVGSPEPELQPSVSCLSARLGSKPNTETKFGFLGKTVSTFIHSVISLAPALFS